MFKEAFLCGLGLAADLSGSYFLKQPRGAWAQGPTRVAAYWQSVGGYIKKSIESEGPKIEKEAKQLSLNLG